MSLLLFLLTRKTHTGFVEINAVLKLGIVPLRRDSSSTRATEGPVILLGSDGRRDTKDILDSGKNGIDKISILMKNVTYLERYIPHVDQRGLTSSRNQMGPASDHAHRDLP